MEKKDGLARMGELVQEMASGGGTVNLTTVYNTLLTEGVITKDMHDKLNENTKSIINQ